MRIREQITPRGHDAERAALRLASIVWLLALLAAPSAARDEISWTFADRGTAADERYVGDPIDLSLRDADLVETLRTLARIGDFNLIVQPGIGGSVTVELRGVPWDQALEVILKTHGLGMEVSGGTLRVASYETLEKEARNQRFLSARPLLESRASKGRLRPIEARKDADGAADDPYSYREPSRDGIGKVYLGREISHVMGHLGRGWLERPSREEEERTDLLVELLPLEPDDVVADLGVGSGVLALPIARRVPEGRVLGVDIQPEMLAALEERAAQAGLDNVEPILGTITDPKLPAGTVDLALMVDAYHEFSHPREMMEALVQALAPGGRVALVEYRAEDPSVPIKRLHKMSEAQARREMAAVGLEWETTIDRLPQQHLMLFRRPAE